MSASTRHCVSQFPTQAVVLSLPTIESSFVTHYAKGIRGYAHPEYPALRVATEILNATESYLWVSVYISYW